MTDVCKTAIEGTGQPISITTPGGTTTGVGVIVPVRNTSKKNGGLVQGSAGISEPQRFYLYTDNETAAGARHSDSVSYGTNEYYILWTDSYDTVYGGYTKICMQQKKGGRINEQLAEDDPAPQQ